MNPTGVSIKYVTRGAASIAYPPHGEAVPLVQLSMEELQVARSRVNAAITDDYLHYEALC